MLGTVWAAWHVPFWILLDQPARFGWAHLLLNWAWIAAMSIYLTWLANNTGNSLLLMVIFHWTLNLVTGGWMPVTTVPGAYGIFIVVCWVVALGLVGYYGPKRLRRQVGKDA